MSVTDQLFLGSLLGWLLADMSRGFAMWARIRLIMWTRVHIDQEPRILVKFRDEQWRDEIRRRHRRIQRMMAR